jgi:hypothetical protein
MNKLTSICVLGLSLASFSQAQNLTARTSTQNYNYIYGAGGNVHTDTFSEIRNNVVDSDGMNNAFADSASGPLPGGFTYSAGVGVQLDQAYSIYGPLSNFTKVIVESGASAHADTVNGTAQLLSANPGNGLVLNFELANPTDYHFNGFIESSPTEVGIGNYIALQRFDGFVWQNTHNTIFLPGQQGSFDYSGTLSAGQYRLTSANSVTVFGNEDVFSSYSYNFEAVPEPVTMFAIAPALMFLARKRKKS